MSQPGGPGTLLARNFREYAVAAAGYSPGRDGAGMIFLNGNYYLLGGWNTSAPWSGSKVTNEIYRFDGASTWTLIHADNQSPGTSCWTPRHTAGWLTHTYQGTTYAYVIGSDIFNGGGAGTSDVWRSSDMSTWTRVTNTAAWGPRVLHMSASYAGALYVMGGQTSATDVSTSKKDVWRSTDGGATWTQLADAGWSNRGLVYNPCEFNGKLWVCGGGKYDDAVPANSTFLHDVWSYDGSNWTQVTAAAAWQARHYNSTFAYRGSLWVCNGWNGSTNIGDAWWSPDGSEWIQSTAQWPQSHADAFANDGVNLWMSAGNHMQTNAWRVEGF